MFWAGSLYEQHTLLQDGVCQLSTCRCETACVEQVVLLDKTGNPRQVHHACLVANSPWLSVPLALATADLAMTIQITELLPELQPGCSGSSMTKIIR